MEATSSGWPMSLSDCIPITMTRPASVLVKFDTAVSITPGDGVDADAARIPLHRQGLDRGVVGNVGVGHENVAACSHRVIACSTVRPDRRVG
jgi:hypothetical protein